MFGWLGDRIGRVRAMTASILVYSLFTGGCALATHPWHLGAFAVSGGAGDGRRMVVGRGAGDGVLAGETAAAAGGGDRRGGERRVRVNRLCDLDGPGAAGFLALGDAGRGGPGRAGAL